MCGKCDHPEFAELGVYETEAMCRRVSGEPGERMAQMQRDEAMRRPAFTSGSSDA